MTNMINTKINKILSITLNGYKDRKIDYLKNKLDKRENKKRNKEKKLELNVKLIKKLEKNKKLKRKPINLNKIHILISLIYAIN